MLQTRLDWWSSCRYQRYAEDSHPALPALLEQRPHLDSDVRHGRDYYGRDDRRGDCCPCGELLCNYNRAEISIPVDDQRIMSSGGSGSAVAEHQLLGVGGGRPKNPLPPNASSTLFVLGVPLDCSRREVHHIFRIFCGYKGIRLVASNSNGNPVVHCFVDFESPSYAATAMDCLQGYVLDENDPNSTYLMMQFADSRNARSGA